MRSHKAELPDLDPEAGGNHAVGFGRGLVTLDRIHREVFFKELRQAGIPHLLFNRFLAGVGQRHY